MQPRVTILLPAYNAATYLAEAIESMLKQTYTDFELLIIDDGSTDNTAEVVRAFTDPRIVFVQNEQNMGLANTLNKGMRIAKGEYLCRMDADDISLPTRLETQVNYLDAHPDTILCSCALHLFGAIEKDSILYNDFERIKIDLLFGSAVGHASSVWRNKVFVENNLFFQQDEFPAEDFGLWTRVAKVGKMVNIPDLLYWYRIYPNQVTSNTQRCHEKCDLVRTRYIQNICPDLSPEIIANFVQDGGKRLTFSQLRTLLKALRETHFFAYKRLRKTLVKIFINNNFRRAMRLYLRLKEKFRNRLYIYMRSKQLKNNSFAIISNDCWGGKVYEDFGMQFTSPTVGLFFEPEGYVRFCTNLEHYLQADLHFIEPAPDGYPIALLDDVKIYFQHYKTEQECIEKWNRRKERLKGKQLFFKFSDRDYATSEQLHAFDALPYPKVIFTAQSFGLKNEIVIDDYTENGFVGDLYSNPWPWRKRFNVAQWLNRLIDK